MTDVYRQAVDDELVVAGVGVAVEGDSYADAREKLFRLIEWHVAVATDERANGGYRLVHVGALGGADDR